MFSFARKAALAGVAIGFAGPALAADLMEPVVEQAPPQVVYQEAAADYSGWYIRGDVDYHWSKFRGADYITYGPPPGTNSFTQGDLSGAWSLGAGVGYQMNQHLRSDVTLDWLAKSKFHGSTTGDCDPPVAGTTCVSSDSTSYSALLLLANAYVDIGTWHGITPYVGAGIGGAWIKWDELTNSIENGGTYTHNGGKGWRFAYSLAAGASYCLTRNLDLDVGYRFSHVNGGKMFDFGNGVGPGYDKGLNVHEVRGGLRYSFGGNSRCDEPQAIAYEPEPIYTK
jgi:opacity protein-like surface antigen